MVVFFPPQSFENQTNNISRIQISIYFDLAFKFIALKKVYFQKFALILSTHTKFNQSRINKIESALEITSENLVKI